MGIYAGFDTGDFANYDDYRWHSDNLERTQRLNNHIFAAWNSISNFFEPHSGWYMEMQGLLERAVQLGYEAALGLPHKATDYDLDERTLDGYADKCRFCKHEYLVYGCESECARLNNGLPCKLEAKEYVE